MIRVGVVAGSSVATARGIGVVAGAGAGADNSSRLPRGRSFSRPQLHPLDATRSRFLHAAANDCTKRDAIVRTRAATGDRQGDDLTMMPSSTSSSSSPSPSTQQQQDLELLRRAQARDTGTTYPLEETKVSGREKPSRNRVARSSSLSFFFRSPRPRPRPRP